MDKPDEQKENDKSQPSSSDEPSKTKRPKELNVVSVPNDQDMIAEEMAELFEEDQVTHKHGSSEPEGD